MPFNYQEFRSPAGRMYLVGTETQLHAVVFQKQWASIRKRFNQPVKGETPILKAARRQLQEYFQGQRQSFDIAIELSGTDFQKRVWMALSKIPFGQTRTYKQQAVSVQNAKASRAVGRTNGLNLLCVILPCHRVIGSSGALTGYAGGLAVKKFLLAFEQTRGTALSC